MRLPGSGGYRAGAEIRIGLICWRGMAVGEHTDYKGLAESCGVTRQGWDAFVREELVPRWMGAYRAATSWDTEVMEIAQDELTFLFDGAPTMCSAREGEGEDRVVAVWGRSRLPDRVRDRARLAGFIPNPLAWSGAGRDRGHFVAHAAGGGLDLNLFPRSAVLNRGRTEARRGWRWMEMYEALHPGTPLFVRPIYDTPRWIPAALDRGLLADEGLWCERFANHP